VDISSVNPKYSLCSRFRGLSAVIDSLASDINTGIWGCKSAIFLEHLRSLLSSFQENVLMGV
jgi:hypothetical protein